MRTGRPNGLGAGSKGAAPSMRPVPRAARAVLLCAALILAAAGPASAAPQGTDAAASPEGSPDAPSRGWLSVALLTGSTQFDAGLADYQWNTSPRFGWGVLGAVGRGRWSAGVELWRASTTQSIGSLGPAPDVHATSAELVGEARVAERWGTGLWIRGHGGLMHLGYHPNQVEIQPPGPVSPVVVDLDPIRSWTGGAGVALRRGLSDRWALGLGLDARWFAIDTAHRAGTEVVYARETFGAWSARCEIARVLGRR